jgi:c(7)-type cytochrome triheme protein
VSWSRRSAAPGSTFRAEGGISRGGLAALLLALAAAAQAQQWLPLAKDGIRDPKSPAIGVLQEPAEALSRLPRDTAGDLVDWGRALESGAIQPRSKLYPGTEVRLLDSDILLNLKGGQPIVRFPHRQHTLWLDCSNCHESIFKSQAGANRLSKLLILQGEQCGVCHGAVAFPLTECARCHNTPRQPAAKK